MCSATGPFAAYPQRARKHKIEFALTQFAFAKAKRLDELVYQAREHLAHSVVKIQKVIHAMKKAEPDAGFDGRCPYGIDIIRKCRGRKPPCEKVRRAELPSRLQ